jgi:hypothetical protein
MAAKKTAKKTKESTPAKAPAPVAKKAAKKAVTKAAKSPAPKAAKKAAPKITTDMIAREAYLNYRRRVEQGLPGDSHTDWLEAERQLSKSGGR